jgi:hypothetical protein
MFDLFDIHWISSNVQRILGDMPYPQFAERICGYPWILRMLPQSRPVRGWMGRQIGGGCGAILYSERLDRSESSSYCSV